MDVHTNHHDKILKTIPKRQHYNEMHNLQTL